MAEDNKKWYTIKVVGGKELKVKEHLESDIERFGLSDHIGRIIVPTQKTIQIRNGKKKNVDKVLFSGYVFLEANLVGEVPHVIKSVNSSMGLLGGSKNSEPMPLTAREVRKILDKVDDMHTEANATVDFNYDIGEMVNIIDGPFSNFKGSVVEIYIEKNKVELEVEMFNRKTSVSLSFNQIEKV